MEKNTADGGRAVTGDEFAAVAAVLSLFCRLADQRDAEKLSTLFTTDGRLLMGDVVLQGRAAIQHALATRLNAERFTQHQWTNPLLIWQESGVLKCHSVQLTIEFQKKQSTPLTRVSTVDDLLRCEGHGRWLLMERSVQRRMNW